MSSSNFPKLSNKRKRGRIRRRMAQINSRPVRGCGQRGRRSAARDAAPDVAPAPAAPAAPPAAPAAPAAAPAAIVPASARDEGPATKRLCRRPDGPIVPRATPWGRVIDGRPLFVIARTHGQGELKAITVTCNLHWADGQRCNKSLSVGIHFTEEEATRRIKEWCVAGMALADERGARQNHMDPMFCNLRTMTVRSDEELEALVS